MKGKSIKGGGLSNASNYRVGYHTGKVPVVGGKYCEPNDRYIFDIYGDVFHWEFDKPIGRIAAHYVNLTLAMNEGGNVFLAMDAHSQTLSDFSEVLDSDDMELDPAYSDDCYYGQDLLVVDTIELEPEHRGKNLGIFLMKHVIDVFGNGCGLIAIEAHPIQYRESSNEEWVQRINPKLFKGNKATGVKKLEKYWSKLGFEKLPNSRISTLVNGGRYNVKNL